LVPFIVTVELMAPEVGERLVIVGARTVNATPLLATWLNVTTTFPVVAPAGTATTIDVLLQLVIESGRTAAPLNVTLLLYWL
jgi:hypothetical protein